VTARDDSLEKRIDAALASWPLREPDAPTWENMAENIEARISTAGKGASASAGNLLDPPFPRDVRDRDDLNTVRTSGIPSAQTSERSSHPGGTAPGIHPAPGGAGGAAARGGEERMSSSQTERERDRRSLKDLAKLANSPSLTPPPPPSKAASPSSGRLSAAPASSASVRPGGDSGIVDLKMMAHVDPQAGERAKDTKLASAELFDDEPVSERPPPMSAPSSGGRISAAPSSGRLATASTPTPASAGAKPVAGGSVPAPQAGPKPEGSKGGMAWVGVVAALAVAAAAIFMVRGQPSEPNPSAAVAKAAPVALVPQASSSAASPSQPLAMNHPPAAGENAPSAPDDAIDPSRLPQAPLAHGPGVFARSVSAPQKSVTVAGGKTEATPPPPPPQIVAKDLPANPSQTGSFDNALRQAAGPVDTPPAEGATTPSNGPAFDPGSVPQKPSTGAIASGIGNVMGEARACLGLDDPISYASVTFSSSGAVSNVVVSGFAAGKPAEACIKGALSKAKVGPFAQPSYTQKVTVRPNS
jgi:hypothetical protein